MCTCVTFCLTRQLLNSILIGHMAFREQELCVIVLHSAGLDSYLKLLALVQWHLEDDIYLYVYYILLDQTII